MTNDKTSVTGSDEAHDDLMATLAAARDLNPDMDKTLADQYLARRREEQQRQDQQSPPVVRQQDGSAARPEWSGRPVVPMFALLMLALMVTAALVTHGGVFWGFFWIPLMFGGWWWRRGVPASSSDWRYQRHMEREQYRRDRLAARYGFSPGPDASSSSVDAQAADQAPSPPGATLQIPWAGKPPETPSAGGQFAGGAPPANPAG